MTKIRREIIQQVEGKITSVYNLSVWNISDEQLGTASYGFICVPLKVACNMGTKLGPTTTGVDKCRQYSTLPLDLTTCVKIV
jgi:hypothetical protein